MKISIRRSSPATMVTPARPTPHGTLDLSAIDRLPGLMCKVQTFHVYRHGVQPGKVIREALAEALVHYYPLAGRLTESGAEEELKINCTGEGIWFAESSADCSLEDVNFLDHPLVVDLPDDLLLPDPAPEVDHQKILVLMKVTEFECGGFVIGLQFCHSVCDGLGAAQFLKMVGDFARGVVDAPTTIAPLWLRESIPSPPKRDQVLVPTSPIPKLEKVVIDVPTDDINRFKEQFSRLAGRRCSTFEVLTANAWQCRARAITVHDHEVEMRLVFFANARPLLHPPLPPGFYGNCFFPVEVSASAGVLRQASSLEVVRMIQEAKEKMPEAFHKWATGEGTGDPYLLKLDYTSFFVSEWSRLGFDEVDYGWGKADHLVPLSFSDVMPVCIIASPPVKKKGCVRLATQCVEDSHVPGFREQLLQSFA